MLCSHSFFKTYMYNIVKDLNVYYHLRESHYLEWNIPGKPPYNMDLILFYIYTNDGCICMVFDADDLENLQNTLMFYRFIAFISIKNY